MLTFRNKLTFNTHFYKIIALTLLSQSNIFSQPSWVTEIINQASDNRPHKEASLLVLLNWEKVIISGNSRSKSEIRKVYKILKPSGVAKSYVHEYSSPLREIDDLEGWLINKDGAVEELQKKDIVEISSSGLQSTYHERKDLVAGFHEAQVGEIIAYRYRVIDKEIFCNFRNFIFQNQQPVMNARYEVEIPEDWKLRKSEWRMDSIKYFIDGQSHCWLTKDLPFESEEPFVPSENYKKRIVTIDAYDTLEQSGNYKAWLNVSNQSPLNMNSNVDCDTTIQSFVYKLTQGFSTPLDRVRAIARFTANDIRYVAVELGEGRWQPRPASLTLSNRYGDCKDKTALMRSMLKVFEIPTYPVYVNATGKIDPDFPSPFWFNHAIIGIPASSLGLESDSSLSTASGLILYDPTNQYIPFGSFPNYLRDNYVLIARNEEPVLIYIPLADPKLNYTNQHADVVIYANGSIDAKITIQETGIQAAATRHNMESEPPHKIIEGIQNFYEKIIPKAVISNYKTTDEYSTIIISFDLVSRNVGYKGSEIQPLQLNIFELFKESPFKPEPRQHPVYFGPPTFKHTVVNWQLPKSMIVEPSVEPISYTSKIGNVYCNVNIRNEEVTYETKISCNGIILDVAEYQEAQNYYRQINAANTLTLITRKK